MLHLYDEREETERDRETLEDCGNIAKSSTSSAKAKVITPAIDIHHTTKPQGKAQQHAGARQ
jgi:hypothetical protein